MTLKGVLSEDEYGGLAEGLRSEYVKGEDDQYYLDVEAVNGWSFENVDGLRTTMRSERQRREQWEKKHADLERTIGGASPEDIQKLGEMKEELERLRQLPDQAKVDERVRTLETQYKQKLDEAGSERDKGYAERDTRIKRLLVSGESRRLLMKLGCIEPDLHTHAIDMATKVGDNDEIVVVDNHGDPLPTARKGAVGNMTLEEFCESLRKRYPQNFKGAGASGGGADPSGAGGPGGMKTDQFSKLPPAERLKQIRMQQAAART